MDRSQLRDEDSKIEYGQVEMTWKSDVGKQYLCKIPGW